MLKLTCPHCQSQFTFAAVPPGTPVRCRSCKQSFTTPDGGNGITVTPENIFGPAAGRAAAAAPASAPAPTPEPARKAAPEPEPVAAQAKPERPLPRSVRGPLEAETAHLCPKCGLTSVAPRGSGPPSWTSHALGVLALVVLHCVMPGTVGLAIGIAAWALAFIVLNVLLRTTPGFKCTTCAHAWE